MKNTVKRMVKKIAAVTLAAAMVLVAAPAKSSEAKVNIKYGTFSYAYNKGKAVWMIDLKKAKNNKVKIGIVWSDKTKSFDTKKYFTKKLKSTVSFKVKGQYKGSKKTKTISGKITFKGKKLKCKINGQSFTAKKVPEPDNPSREEIESDVWVTAEDPTIQEGVQEKFDIINKTDNGITFVPIATLATKVTAEGTSWRVFSKEVSSMPGGKTYYEILEITEYMDGSVAVTRQYTTMLEDIDSNLDGGWHLTDTPVLDSSLSPKVVDLADMLTGGAVGVSITPLAEIAVKVTNGTSILLLCEKKAVVPKPDPRYFFITVNLSPAGDLTVDKDSYMSVYLDDHADEATRKPNSYFLREGLEIKDTWICYMGETNGKKWYNFGAIFANSTDEDIELDLSKFSFRTKDATGGLTWKTWHIRKNASYVQWATTAISEDFLSKIKVGDAVEISYDGNVLCETTVEDHSI